tara:strand:+ start:765 stop:1631 length:867 start_codon:yes stop_codon:yes gene_type:complete
MPELPEVEVVKKSLESQINNLTIKSIKIHDSNLRYKVKKQDISKIIGLKILKVKRRSKYLLFHLNKDFTMIAHLGMTGKFFIKDRNKIKKKTSFYYDLKEYNKSHNRIIFVFKNESKLIYNDVRKFGFVKVILNKNIKNEKHLKILGPEPFNKLYNFEYFKRYINGKKRTIKDLLMDQKFLAGLGNIYVNEILFLCKIKPNRKLHKLNDQEIKDIIINTKKVLKKAIIYGGSSIKNFSSGLGKKGNFQQQFNVYGKNKYKCSNSDCNGIVKKIVISNRASFYCSKCQK